MDKPQFSERFPNYPVDGRLRITIERGVSGGYAIEVVDCSGKRSMYIAAAAGLCSNAVCHIIVNSFCTKLEDEAAKADKA